MKIRLRSKLPFKTKLHEPATEWEMNELKSAVVNRGDKDMVGPLDFYGTLDPDVVYKWRMRDGKPSFTPTRSKCRQSLKTKYTSDMRSTNVGEHVVVKANWLKAGDRRIKDNKVAGAGAGNVFGETGRLIMPVSPLNIPVIDALKNREYVRSFGFDLIPNGGKVCMPERFSKRALVVTYRFSKDYAVDFLSQGGRGAFLETHAFPQYFAPAGKSVKSYFMVAKYTDAKKSMLEITSFHIPYGYLLVSKEHAIHGDSYAVGKMLVTFDTTESEADVVYFRRPDYKIPRVNFASPNVVHGVRLSQLTDSNK